MNQLFESMQSLWTEVLRPNLVATLIGSVCWVPIVLLCKFLNRYIPPFKGTLKT